MFRIENAWEFVILTQIPEQKKCHNPNQPFAAEFQSPNGRKAVRTFPQKLTTSKVNG